MLDLALISRLGPLALLIQRNGKKNIKPGLKFLEIGLLSNNELWDSKIY